MTQTGIFLGRVQIVYGYGCFGYTRGGGVTWHGGIDLVGLDDTTIRMPYYRASDGTLKKIKGKVINARIVKEHSNLTWEWGYYVCVQLNANQTPDDVNFLYFCHCEKLLVQKGDVVESGDALAVMGNSGNAALNDPPYKHCHLEVRATSTGVGLNPTAYSGTDNETGTYGTADGQESTSVTAGSLLIDVSKYQGLIDWPSVPYRAIIRVGYRGYGTGTCVSDEFFERNISGALSANKLFGFYWFSQAVSAAEGKEEAEYADKAISGRGNGLPLFIDCEWSNGSHNGRADKISASQRTSAADAFCQRAKELGYIPGVYTFTSFAQSQMDYTSLANKYLGWLADTRANYDTTLPRHIHQYGQSTVSGIVGAVDMNRVIKDIQAQSTVSSGTAQLQIITVGPMDNTSAMLFWGIANGLGLGYQAQYTGLEKTRQILTIGPASMGDAMTLWNKAKELNVPYKSEWVN